MTIEIAQDQQQPSSSAARERLSRVSFEGLRVWEARSPDDFEVVKRMRAEGFGRLIPAADRKNVKWCDDTDFDYPKVRVLICSEGDTPLATMRVDDGRAGPVELERFVPLRTALPGSLQPFAQGARLSAPKSPRSKDAIYALFRSVWGWSFEKNVPSLVMASPPWALPMYFDLYFKPLGDQYNFVHGYGASVLHTSMYLDALRLRQNWERHPDGHPLFAEWFGKKAFEDCMST